MRSTLLTILSLCACNALAQPITGKYISDFNSVLDGIVVMQTPVAIEIALVEGEAVIATYSSEARACMGTYPMAGTRTGNVVSLRATASGAGCKMATFDGFANGSTLTGTLHSPMGTMSQVTLSR